MKTITVETQRLACVSIPGGRLAETSMRLLEGELFDYLCQL
jgi:hypothetical protein